MSMHHDATKADHADDDEEQWIEAEIQRELEALGSVDLEEEPSTGEKDASSGGKDSSSDQDDAEEQGRTAEMDEYIQRMQAQAARLEEELEECDELIHRTDLVVSTPLPEKDDIVLLAQERGMDAETLKRKVLAELDKEDMEDERLLLESVNQDLDQTESNALALTENPHPEAPVSDAGDGQLSSESKSAFLTGVEEEKRTEEEEYLELRRNFLGAGREEETEKQEDEGQNDEEEKEEEQEDQEKDENDYSGKFMLNPGEGTIMSMVDSEALERRVMREVLDWEQKWMAKNEQREQELATIISLEKEREAEIRRQREQRQKEVEQEQQNLHKQQQDVEEKLRKEAEVLQLEIEESIEQYQTEIEMLTESVRMESASLLKSKEEGKKEEDEKRELSALKIQAAYRGYRVYKEEGVKVKEHLEEWKKQKTEARIKAIEKSRKEKADEKKRKEEAEQRKEDEKKRKEEEKLRKEEEKKRRAEEKKRLKEEEEKRKLEEKRQKEEEERKRKEDEKMRKEEEAKRKEEEKKKKEEAKRELERKKREEEELRLQKLKEEEARQLEEQKQAEEKKKREEEERRKLEEEEERKRQEAEAETAAKRAEEDKVKQLGLGTPLSPVPPEGRPKTPRKKINDLRRSTMSPLANGVKSPPSSAGSQRSGPNSETDQGQPGTGTRTEALTTARSVTGLKTPRTARSDMSLSLPELIEKSRLEWIGKCRPWSKTERELKTKNKSEISRKPLRRPISAKNMSVLPEDQILIAAGVASLQQVTTVELHDLPGSSLKTLGQCTRLKTLKVTNCGAVTTEGLGDCKHLVYLDMQHNALETINLRDLERLVYLDLSHNCLTTLQGLEGCASLRYLRAAHNRMTRITGLEGMKSLHTLDLSHNQLITTKGLGAVPTLQEVDLTHNHLPSLDDLDHLGLLQVLKAGGNNIIQPPLLTNHVLLRQLSLEDNSLCSIHNLSQCWLPLLRQLALGQNSLTSLEELSTCVSLQDLDISNNQILDIESLSPGLQSCRHLTQLKTEGNPAREEPEFSSSVVKLVPSLEKLDGKAVGSPRAAPLAVTDFENMCLEQLAIWDKLTSQYQQVLSGTTDIPSVASVHVRYFTTSHNVAVEQRYAHEYGEVNTDSTRVNFDLTPEPPGTPQGPPGKTPSDASKMKNKFEQALQNANGSNSVSDGKEILKNSLNSEGIRQSVRNSKVGRGNIGADVIGKKLQQRGGLGDSDRHAAATRIQALWRGYQIRRDIDQHSRWWLAATSIQAAWRGHFTRTVLREMGYLPIPGGKDDRRHKAATLIQATWRGYLVRKRIQYALNYARMSFGEDEMDEDLDFTEVDLSAFDFNEDDLEKGWTPPETPQLPANTRDRRHKPNKPKTSHAVIGKPSSTQQAAAAKAAFDAAFSPPGPKPPSGPISLVKRPPHPPQHPPLHHPRHAWRNVDSPLSDVPPLGSRPPLPPLSRLSDHSAAETHRTGETSQRTFRSRKEEQLTEEWGFKDTKTAELMMQRAKKLKYNAARKKKISQLDPRQRLALFRKLEETTTVPHVKPPPKKIMPRKEYFQAPGNPARLSRHHSLPALLPSAREEEVQQKAMEKQRDQVNHHQRTYEWIHTQVGSYPAGASSRINQGLNEASHHNSEGNLPQIDPNVLAGARHNLTGSPMSLDIQSLDSVSTAGDLHRRHSSGGDPAARLPPIKVSSAPSAHVSERMSFRNPKPKATLESVGWGSGKKRANRR